MLEADELFACLVCLVIGGVIGYVVREIRYKARDQFDRRPSK